MPYLRSSLCLRLRHDAQNRTPGIAADGAGASKGSQQVSAKNGLMTVDDKAVQFFRVGLVSP